MYNHLPIHMTITEFRRDISKAADRVIEDRIPLIITRGSKEPLAVVPYSDLAGYEETEYLMKHPGYGQKLVEHYNELKAGKVELISKTMEELYAMEQD
jgi:antitoxin YefM